MIPATELSESATGRHEISRRWARHRLFQAWQAAREMNAVFGEGYVEVPPLPTGYEIYARYWLINVLHTTDYSINLPAS